MILTIGHSNRTLEELVRLLVANEVELLGDIRSAPGSRRNPQFNKPSLQDGVLRAGMKYELMSQFGGRREPKAGSVNTALDDFLRAYADYMQSEKFEKALQELTARPERTAVMCAENDYLNCHRQLLSDALLVRGVAVEHIFRDGPRKAHVLTPFARPDGTRLTYPNQERDLFS